MILNDVWLDIEHLIWWVNFCFPQKTDHSARIGRGFGTAEQEVMDHLSHLTMCVRPRHLSEVTWSHRNSLVSRIGSPPRDRCHSLSAESSWPLMLYCTEEWHLTLLTHRMSADCYFTCHITLIFLEMISGYLETKEKKSVDSVVSSSELKSQVFMNGKLAFGRCNTYFNVTFFHAFVLCNVMGTDQTEVSTVINNAFFLNILLSACCFTVTPNSN